MIRRRRWSDDEVVEWAYQYAFGGTNLKKMEKELKVSHSTLYWCFIHRLPNIDRDLYNMVIWMMEQNKRREAI